MTMVYSLNDEFMDEHGGADVAGQPDRNGYRCYRRRHRRPATALVDDRDEPKSRDCDGNGLAAVTVTDAVTVTNSDGGDDDDDDDGDNDNDREMFLHPLNNQVGGHTRLLQLDSSTICKPLNDRELKFYQNIPDDIKEFVPKFKGVIQAVYSSDKQPDNRYSPSFSGGGSGGNEPNPSAGSSLPTKRKRDDNLFKMRISRYKSMRELQLKLEDNSGCDGAGKGDGRGQPAADNSSSKQYFLMLENVTSKFDKANILDLKMGTRQYCDDAPLEKRTKQTAKCQATTSAALGVRLCGMQVYQTQNQNYLKRDKYWGRKLNESSFCQALRTFFTDNSKLRVRVIEELLAKLTMLRAVIEKQTCFRFYSCSLLIVYEGNSALEGAMASSGEETAPSMDNDDDSFLDMRDVIESATEAICDDDDDDDDDDEDEDNEDNSHQVVRSRCDFVPISEETVFLDGMTTSASPSTNRTMAVRQRAGSTGDHRNNSWYLCNNTNSSSCCSDEYSLPQTSSSSSSSQLPPSHHQQQQKQPHANESFEFKSFMKGNRYPIDFDSSPRSQSTLPFSKSIPSNMSRQLRPQLPKQKSCDNAEPTVASQPEQMPSTASKSSLVEMRIIDFANASFALKTAPSSIPMQQLQQQQQPIHKGPDCGFLTGLDSLIRLLNMIRSDYESVLTMTAAATAIPSSL